MKYNDLASAIKSPIFSRNDLALSGYNVLDYQLSLWVKKGYLIRLKNGLYAFSREKEKLRSEVIAFLLYQPSYLSLESALAWYGFIPEIVYAYTSITARITRTFENVSFLMGLAGPDFTYIEKTLELDRAEFLRRFDGRLGELDLNLLARDVEPFLFAPEQQERITSFRDYWLSKPGRFFT